MPTAAVTGANGYVGGVIAGALQRAGWNIIELTRTPSPRSSAAAGTFRKFSLNDEIEPKALEGINALVHCAYDFAPIDAQGIRKSNVTASLALFNAARLCRCTAQHLHLVNEHLRGMQITVRPGQVGGRARGGQTRIDRCQTRAGLWARSEGNGGIAEKAGRSAAGHPHGRTGKNVSLPRPPG